MRSVSKNIFLGLLLVTCSTNCGSGRLLITLDRPILPELDPVTNPLLSKFSLRIIQSGAATEQDALRSTNTEIELGTVPTDAPFDLRLAGKTATDEIVGMGLTQGLRVPASEEKVVYLKFRRPLGYIAGGSSLAVLNVMANPKDNAELSPLDFPNAADIAVTPDSGLILAAVNKSLVIIGTSDHDLMETVDLPAAASCVAISPDGRYAVVCHSSTKTFSILEISRIGSPSLQLTTKDAGGVPYKIAFTDDSQSAWILLNGETIQNGCSKGVSQLLKIDLATGRTLRQVTSGIGKPVADVVIDPRDKGVLLALPCEGKGALGRLNGESVEILASVPRPYDLVVTEQSILTMGSVGDTPGKLQITRFDLTKQGFSTSQVTQTLTLPALMIQVSFKTSTSETFYDWQSIPIEVRAYDIAVAPEGRRALMLFQATYASEVTLTNDCDLHSQITGIGYALVDPSSATLIMQKMSQLRFSDCSIKCQGGFYWTKSTCEAEYRHALQGANLLTSPEFQPTNSTILFGGS